MENFDVSNPDYTSVLRKLETTDRGHADVFNAIFSVLINNDEFLKKVVETLALSKQDAQPGKGLSEANYTAIEKQKLSGIAEGANAYTHPSHVAKASGLYLITVDDQGHVASATAVSKADITGLGIPGQDTVYTHPMHTARASGLYKVAVDAQGHVSGATAVSKADITALGIASAEAATLTAGRGITVTTAANGSKTVAQKGARVYIGETAPDPNEFDLHVW